ncbi:glycosyltransferase family 2 protein [Williamsia maris]|uniref:Glycosyltransferase, GT2 family n=1 Tax=Williamsia maris TaxID=72806 RepID=A0ABT1HD35_9NOCA|nr:galactosyltransferase-related protein [Williamsia maris]MCP2175625.1 Glycosyltransferase, GT2 family [Williamsia maris]
MKIAVVTVVAGRHDHLTAQIRGLVASTVAPCEHVVVAMGDERIAPMLTEIGSTATCIEIAADGPLPLARARNLGARRAIEGGADLLVFLDVDCIPGRNLIARYAAAAWESDNRDCLLCGPVTYLPANIHVGDSRSLDDLTAPHPARPDPPNGRVEPGEDFDLFWSLSFAVEPSTWSAIGGFCEDYRGYGGEDTDFAATAEQRGIGLRWIGGAHAYHQHHPVSDPPVEHLDDIIDNARVFFDRWGRWPMTGWLDGFEEQGLLRRDREGTIARSA